MNVTGILQATQIVTTKPISVNNLTVSGALSASTVTTVKDPANKIGVTMSLTMNNINNEADLLSIPDQCRSLGVTDLEIWHGINTYYSFCANKVRPTIEELTPFKNACIRAGISIVSVLVDNTSNNPASSSSSLLGSSNLVLRNEVVSFVEDMAPVYKFLGCKMMRFTIDTDPDLHDFMSNAAHKATMFTNILDSFTRSTAVAQGLILTAENHSNFTDPQTLIELYDYITPTIPTFSYVVDTNNWFTDTSDKPTKTYALAPYAYQFSVKISDFDQGYMNPDGTKVNEITVDRKLAFSEKGFTDLNHLMDIFEDSTNVPIRSKSPLMIENERNSTDGLDKIFIVTKRIFLQVFQRYPRFMNAESGMLAGGMMAEIDKDLNYYNQNIKSVIEQSQRNEEIVTQERMENWQERTYNKINRGKKYHYIVVGAGSAGASAAQALASFTRGAKKFVLLIERGPSRPLSYIGGYNFYSNFIQPGADKLNSVFGQYYIKEEAKLTSSLVERLLTCIAGMPTDETGNIVGTNVLTGCNDPVVFGGGSTYNGSNSHLATDWYNERNALRGGCIVDIDALNTCGQYIFDVMGNREDDYFTLAQNDTVSRVFTSLVTDNCFPWIGDATGELKKEMLPSKIIKNLALSSAESGGIRWGMQSLRMRSTGYPRRNASASIVEQFDNNFFNLDVLCNTKCNKIMFEKYDSSGNSYMRSSIHGTPGQYVRDESNAAVAYGINVTYNDLVDETNDESSNVFLKDSGEIFVAGNVYNSPIILEQSGIGRQTLIESCGYEFVSENLEIGENLHNNYITGGVCAGVAIAVPYGTVSDINKTAYKSNKDVRRVLIEKQMSTFSIAHHDDSDRSRVRGNIDISVPTTEQSIIVITPGGLDSEISGAVTFGNVHSNASASDRTIPIVNFNWFDGGKDGKRNLDGAVRAVKKVYSQFTSNAAAYYCLGSGFDSNEVAIERDSNCAANSNLYTDALDSDGNLKSGWFKSNAGGVYNKGYAGLNMDTATYDQIKNKVTTVGIREAIHWNGTVAYGKATDKDFIIKGTQNVRCCCSAVMNEPYPQNNWAMVTQWARYIVMHSLGLTAPIVPSENFANKIAEVISNVIPISIASNTSIFVTGYNSETYDLSYYIIKNSVRIPSNTSNIVATFSGATINTDETASLYNFRTINTAKNAYDIPVTGGLYDEYDCGIMQSKLQFELLGQTSLSSTIFIYEINPSFIQDVVLFGLTDTIVSLSILYRNEAGDVITTQDKLDEFNGYPLTNQIYDEGQTAFGGILTINHYLNYASWGYPADIKRVELCTHRWTQAGLDWAYINIFKDDNKGGRINVFENSPTHINDPVYFSSYKIIFDSIGATQQFLIDNDYITVNLWYDLSIADAKDLTGGALDPEDLDLRLNHLRISMAAYDVDDKFVDDIGDVPIKPGTHRFVRQS